MLHSNNVSQKCNTDKEIEKEIERDDEKLIKTENIQHLHDEYFDIPEIVISIFFLLRPWFVRILSYIRAIILIIQIVSLHILKTKKQRLCNLTNSNAGVRNSDN